MRIRSGIDIPDRHLRLIRLADTYDTKVCVETCSVVRTHRASNATHTFRVYRVKAARYDPVYFRPFPSGHPNAVISTDSGSITEYSPAPNEEIKRDGGARYEHGGRTATIGA